MSRVAVLLLFLSTPALADDGYALSYQGVEGCPDEAAVQRGVRARVRDASRAAGATLELTVATDGDGLRGTLVFVDRDGARGTRTIRGKSCTEVSDALVFFAGLAIELGTLESDEPAPEPEPAPKPKPKPKPPPPEQKPVEDPGARMSLGLSAGARGGLSPRPRPYAGLGFELGSARERVLSPSVRASAIGSWSRLDGDGGHARLVLIGARLDACPVRFASAPVAFSPCFAFEAAPVFASGKIEENPKQATEPWLATELLGRVQWRAGEHFYAELDAGVVFPLRHSRYYFEPDRTLYTVPGVTGRGATGLGYVF